MKTIRRARKTKGSHLLLHTTTVCWLRAQSRPSTQIAKVLCGNACVSIHLNPVSTPSLRSVGHSLQVHGTPAQYKLATSTYLNVGCNVAARQEPRAKPRKSKDHGIRRKMLFIANESEYFYIE